MRVWGGKTATRDEHAQHDDVWWLVFLRCAEAFAAQSDTQAWLQAFASCPRAYFTSCKQPAVRRVRSKQPAVFQGPPTAVSSRGMIPHVRTTLFHLLLHCLQQKLIFAKNADSKNTGITSAAFFFLGTFRLSVLAPNVSIEPKFGRAYMNSLVHFRECPKNYSPFRVLLRGGPRRCKFENVVPRA